MNHSLSIHHTPRNTTLRCIESEKLLVLSDIAIVTWVACFASCLCKLLVPSDKNRICSYVLPHHSAHAQFPCIPRRDLDSLSLSLSLMRFKHHGRQHDLRPVGHSSRHCMDFLIIIKLSLCLLLQPSTGLVSCCLPSF